MSTNEVLLDVEWAEERYDDGCSIMNHRRNNILSKFLWKQRRD